MAKDPAFLFYSDNFQSGTQFFSDEQTGKYIRLLCAQHLHGHLEEKHMLFICGSYDKDIWCKFKKDQDGKYFNERMETEVLKRRSYAESRSNNRKSTTSTKKNPKNISSSYDNHMGNGNGNGNVNDNRIKSEDWESVKRNFFNAYQWQEKFCRDKNILLPTLKIRMEEFISDVELKEDWKDLRELKSHFTNLFNKNKNGFKPTQTGRQRGASQLIEIIKQDFAAGRKKDNGT